MRPLRATGGSFFSAVLLVAATCIAANPVPRARGVNAPRGDADGLDTADILDVAFGLDSNSNSPSTHSNSHPPSKSPPSSDAADAANPDYDADRDLAPPSMADILRAAGVHPFEIVDRAPEGWLGRWLMGGEGAVTVTLGDANLTLPHRPAAFPDLGPAISLPLTGTLIPFTSLHASEHEEDAASGRPEPPERACVRTPARRPSTPGKPYTFALVERGGCDFATKVRAAQSRGAAAVVVGDTVAYTGETDEEGRKRENLITMYSPEDTSSIIIPSVFISRASYLALRDLLVNHTNGLEVEIGEAEDDGSALGNLLTFALLMPSLFLLATIAAHRVRVARQREANRAPPTVVLSLPERVWSPDIVWEKDDSESDKDVEVDAVAAGGAEENDSGPADNAGTDAAARTERDRLADGATSPDTPDTNEADDEAETTDTVPPPKPRRSGKERRKSKRYYSKDECAICMDNFHRGEVVRILPCGHVFHKDECDEWLLKWRKLCPTCRADVTVSVGDLSGSTTLTPVVTGTGEAAGASGAGVVAGDADEAVDDAEGGMSWARLAGWRDRVGASVGGAARSVSESLRAVVRRPGAQAAASPGAQEAANERTPLVGHV